MVALRENIFMCLQDARASTERLLIGTAAIYADVVISLEELQNTMEMEQVVFDKSYKIIITGDENDEHYGNWKAYQKNKH